MRVLSVDRRPAARARDYLAVRLGIAQYTVFAILVVVVELLPGSSHSHAGVAFGCAVAALAYAAAQAGLPAKPSLLWLFAFGSAGYILLASVAIAASGGAASPLRALLIFSVVYGAWFYETKPAILILAGVILATMLPLSYDGHAFDAEPLGLTIVLAVVLVLSGTLMILARIELSRLRDQARREANRDPLTDLANRRALFRAIERHTTGMGPDDCLGLVFVDLDGFKQINGRYGHAGGDAALEVAASALRTAARAGDIVARVGGDEFAILAPGITRADLGLLAQRAITAVKEAATGSLVPDPGSALLTASAGVALWPEDASDADSVLRAADLAMLSAKRAGKDQVITAQDDATGQVANDSPARPGASIDSATMSRPGKRTRSRSFQSRARP